LARAAAEACATTEASVTAVVRKRATLRKGAACGTTTWRTLATCLIGVASFRAKVASFSIC
jgi:hypothetical protein